MEEVKYTQEDCIKDTQKHIEQVQEFMLTAAQVILMKSEVHDVSKLKSPELEIFTEYTPKLKYSTYGSDEYKSYLKEMKVALDHHYANNNHHPEFHTKGIRGMNLLDIIEMFCDWKAATMRHDDGDIRKSIKINQERFGYSDDLKDILMNTVELFEQ